MDGSVVNEVGDVEDAQKVPILSLHVPTSNEEASTLKRARDKSVAFPDLLQPNQEDALNAMNHSLTTAEVANLRRVFRKFDKNASGTIDPGELQELMQSVGVSTTIEQLEEMIDEVEDTDNGELSFPAFVKLINFWKDASRFQIFEGLKSRKHMQIDTSVFLTDSRGRWVWDFVILISILYMMASSFFFYTLRSEEDHDSFKEQLIVPDIIFSIIMGVEIVVQSNSGFPLLQKFVEDRRVILFKYARSHLLIDLLACIPLWLFVGVPAAKYLQPLRWLKATRIQHLWSPSNRVLLDRYYVSFHFGIVPPLRALSYTLLFVHGCAVVTNLLMQAHEARYNYSFSTCWYFVLYIVTGVGYGDVVSTTDELKWWASALCLMGMVANGIFIGSVVTYMQATDIETERKQRLRETAAVCEFFELPSALEDEVLQFQAHLLMRDVHSYKSVVNTLPEDLISSVEVHSQLVVLASHPLFRSCHPGIQMCLVQFLEQSVFAPEEYIVLADDAAKDMFFIFHGFVDVFDANGTYVTTLVPGQHFGDGALFCPGDPRTESVKALTYCSLLSLSLTSFQIARERFTSFDNLILKEQRKRSLATEGVKIRPHIQEAAKSDVGRAIQSIGRSRKASLEERKRFYSRGEGLTSQPSGKHVLLAAPSSIDDRSSRSSRPSFKPQPRQLSAIAVLETSCSMQLTPESSCGSIGSAGRHGRQSGPARDDSPVSDMAQWSELEAEVLDLLRVVNTLVSEQGSTHHQEKVSMTP